MSRISSLVLLLALLAPAALRAQTNWQQISSYNDGITRQIEQQRQFSSQMDAMHQQQQVGYDGSAGYDSGPSSEAWLLQQVREANDDALRARDYAGVLAYDVEKLVWTWQLDAGSAARAWHDLQKDCPATRCPLVAVFHNTCLAAAVGPAHEYYWGDDVRPRKALAAALAACKAGTGSKDCKAAPDMAMCTGYRYLDSPDKMSRFKRGGLIGVFAPSAAGIARSQPPSVLYNPVMRLFQALPTAEQQTAEARAGALGQARPWAAFGLSPSTSKLSFELSLTEAGAGRAAKLACGAPDCLVALSFQGQTCIASGIGRNPAGQGMFFLQQGTDQAAADAAMERECIKAQASCGAKQRHCFEL